MPELPFPAIEEAAVLAHRAWRRYSSFGPARRSEFLEAIAAELEGLGDELLATTHEETLLPLGRLSGERARTCGQLRLFAKLLQTSDWMDLRDDVFPPETGKPGIKRTMTSLGPVAVFGASNFPLAFSTPGGDTASALAAGCPVVVKSHPAHPRTSQLSAEAILRAAAQTGMPEGVFSLVEGGVEEGQALVRHPLIKAVAFTGSLRAGRALYDLAAQREEPIPVYAEMGSVNPIFLLPGALAARGESLAGGFCESLTLGVGQFCTNPGLALAMKGPDLDSFLSSCTAKLQRLPVGDMLTPGIAASYQAGVAGRKGDSRLRSLVEAEPGGPALFLSSGSDFLADDSLQEELFGPASLVVACEDLDQMEACAEALKGQLTATLHFEEQDKALAARLLPILVEKAGRLVANGFPTGVEVCSAMHHGGPYPASTDSRSTSVGTAAILRFVRPVAFQGFPPDLLPPELAGASS